MIKSPENEALETFVLPAAYIRYIYICIPYYNVAISILFSIIPIYTL